MPTPEEKEELTAWVLDLPKREQLKGFDQVLDHCAQRYDNTGPDLLAAMDAIADKYKEQVNIVMHAAMRQEITPTVLAERMDLLIKAALLRMWTHGAEYSLRWTSHRVYGEFQTELAGLLAEEE